MWQTRNSLLLAIVFFISSIIPASAVSNFCPPGFGTCDIATPVYVNVYWDTNVAQWNADIAANDPLATIARLDSLTAALVHSDYFSGLNQYSVTSITLAPSIVVGGMCGLTLPPTIDAAVFDPGPAADATKASPGPVYDLAVCILNAHPEFNSDTVIMNVFLPPQVGPASGSVWCTQPKGADHFGGSSAITLIPTNTNCNPGIGNILSSLSHEMVEATTDPDPNTLTGWKTCCAGGLEVADQCEIPGPPARPNTEPFIYALVQRYFSNHLNSCQGLSTVAPAVGPATACGTGQTMSLTLNALSGLSFNAPWDFTNTPLQWNDSTFGYFRGSNTLYLQALVSGSHNWTAGWNTSPPETVGLGPISWNGNSLTISGFDSRYGAMSPTGGDTRVSPGDRISLTYWSPSNGQGGTATVTAPGPSKAQISATRWPPAAWAFVGDTVSISGTLTDSGNCAIEGSLVQISASVSSIPSSTTLSGGLSLTSGAFGTFYTTSGPAGTVKYQLVAPPVDASASLTLHPAVTSLNHLIGTVAGGQNLELTGLGFAAGATSISFEGANGQVAAANITHVSNNTVDFVTPPWPRPGFVDLTAFVDGIPSLTMSYEYIVPGQPIIKYIPTPCSTDNVGGDLEINTYNQDGEAGKDKVRLSANYPAFREQSRTVSSVFVSTPAIVHIEGLGPITANAITDPKLTVTEIFKTTPVPPAFCNQALAPLRVSNAFSNPGGPVEDVVVTPDVTDERTVWRLGQLGNQIGKYYLVLNEPSLQTLEQAKKPAINLVSKENLETVIRSGSIALTHQKPDRSGLNILGSAVSIAAGTKVDGRQSLPLPDLLYSIAGNVDVSNFCVLRIEPSAANWVEISSIVTNLPDGGHDLRAKIDADGIYALAEFTK